MNKVKKFKNLLEMENFLWKKENKRITIAALTECKSGWFIIIYKTKNIFWI